LRGLTPAGAQGAVNLSHADNPRILEHHLLYAAEHIFPARNYFRVNGSPVLFLYTLRDYTDFAAPLARIFAAVERRIGAPLYVVGAPPPRPPRPPRLPR